MKRIFVICLVLLYSFSPVNASANGVGSNGVIVAGQDRDEASDPVMPERKNVMKINLSSLLFSGVSLQYERVISSRLSVTAGINYRPEGQLPFAGFIKNAFLEEDEVNANRFLDETMFSYMTITPEARFYPGSSGAPHGFYLAPFFRYGSWDMTSQVEFDRGDDPPVDLRMSGDVSYYGGGLMLGFQRTLNRMTVDWWLLGPFIGSVEGNVAARGDGNINLTEQEKRDIEQDVNDIDTGILDVNAKIGDDRVDMLIGGGILGIRAIGFSLGYRF
ncbi:MAG: hypothetical protein ACLFMU_06230 [Bacteroidales bacterium]